MQDSNKSNKIVPFDGFEFREFNRYVEEIATARMAAAEVGRLLKLLSMIEMDGDERVESLIAEYKDDFRNIAGLSAIFETIESNLSTVEGRIENRLKWLGSEERALTFKGIVHGQMVGGV